MNSAAGREEEYRLRPAEESKKVFIIGGGPAGMEAARIASLRGHQVMLYEKEKQFGGQLNLASIPPYKEPIGEFRGYLSRQLSKSGANVILMKEATTDLILKERPDVVILATGAKPSTTEIKGIENENVALAEEILTRKRQVKARAAVIGGELVACEVAEFLADQGKEVT
ncbi:MAG: NADH:flavin oxidoreductase, partial [Chloroflexi bacterium CG07_land_8_20_14_0_80_45_17]